MDDDGRVTVLNPDEVALLVVTGPTKLLLGLIDDVISEEEGVDVVGK